MFHLWVITIKDYSWRRVTFLTFTAVKCRKAQLLCGHWAGTPVTRNPNRPSDIYTVNTSTEYPSSRRFYSAWALFLWFSSSILLPQSISSICQSEVWLFGRVWGDGGKGRGRRHFSRELLREGREVITIVVVKTMIVSGEKGA